MRSARRHRRWTTFVADIDYNAKGQRRADRYGNGVQTSLWLRPADVSVDQSEDNARFRRRSAESLLHLRPGGNITSIKDAAQQTIFFANTPDHSQRGVHLRCDLSIDPSHRPRTIGQMGQVDHSDPDIHPLPHPNHSEAMRPYTESYEYDGVGNIFEMIHQASGGSWTRYYQYAAEVIRYWRPACPVTIQRTLHWGVQIQSTRQHDIHAPSAADDLGLRRAVASIIDASVQRRCTRDDLLRLRRVRSARAQGTKRKQLPNADEGARLSWGIEIYREYGGEALRLRWSARRCTLWTISSASPC